ncbi:hypothetical protein LK09_14935 [Microbacterium mangrovi]|uniref:FAD-binding domain-containing protein n=1 Tax=Microbacterium mangrovi TaxID=1348253 RepID=A0A0B1ZZF3_9MICO|nr:NAD(P)/FAD-dependent oxidoreductase [Microbacterium mangrovi]KHK96615.1 hypothetical protein LK09_14935 [Microbacterium mangrovi]
MPDVVVVGAGAVGMLLAEELTRRGVDVGLYEQRPRSAPGSRAIGIHATTLAALEQSGVTERLLDKALRVRRGEARADGRVLGVVRFDRLSTRFPFVATLPQSETEAVLASAAPTPIRGARVTGLRECDRTVRVEIVTEAGPLEVDAKILVVATGAGGRGLVYRRAGLHRTDYRDRYLMTDLDAPPRPDADVAVVNLAREGVLESFPLPGGRRRFVAWDPTDADPDPRARVSRLREALAMRGEAGAADAVEDATAFGVRAIVAPRLRRRRVVVIGDAAHEVSPIGGQGMNLGFLDAVGLAPLLAEWVRTGNAPDAELDAWERRRVASARTAARLAAVNTRLGQALPLPAHRLRSVAVRGMLTPPLGSVFAKAYAMGFDADA